MGGLNVFEDISILEPKCPGCNEVVKLGITTKYSVKDKAPVCLNCGYVLR